MVGGDERMPEDPEEGRERKIMIVAVEENDERKSNSNCPRTTSTLVETKKYKGGEGGTGKQGNLPLVYCWPAGVKKRHETATGWPTITGGIFVMLPGMRYQKRVVNGKDKGNCYWKQRIQQLLLLIAGDHVAKSREGKVEGQGKAVSFGSTIMLSNITDGRLHSHAHV